MERVEIRQLLRLARARTELPADALMRERSTRARAIRRLRVTLWQDKAALVQHVRWPCVEWLIEDLAAALAVGPVPIDLLVLSVTSQLRGADGAHLLPHVLAKTLGVDHANLSTSATRLGIRAHLYAVFREAAFGPRRAIIIEGIDGIRFETIQDLCSAWSDAKFALATEPEACVPMLVLMRRIGGASLKLLGGREITIGDPTRDEAISMLASLLGGRDYERLASIVDAVGTVPGFLAASAAAGGVTGWADLREVMGWMWRELEQAVSIVRSQPLLAQRLDLLRETPQPLDERIDRQLRRAGLVAYERHGEEYRVRLRSPLISAVTGIGQSEV